MGAYSDKKYEEARLKQRRTLDTAGLNERLKVQGEPDVADIWSDQKRIQEEDKKIEYNYKQAKAEAKRLKKELRKNDKQTTIEFSATAGRYKKSVLRSAKNFTQFVARIRRPYKVGFVIIAIVFIAGVSFASFRTEPSKTADVLGASSAPAKPDFATVAPDGDPGATVSKKINFDSEKKVANYTDVIATVPVTVSQQVMPEKFKSNTIDELDKLAAQISATQFIKGANVPAYVGTSAKGPQTAVLIKNNNLIFILSQSKIEIADWAEYINRLK